MAPHSIISQSSLPSSLDSLLHSRLKPAPPTTPANNNSEDHVDTTTHQVLRTFRLLVADIVQQYNGGHPGSAAGAAALGVALFKNAMRHNPSNPEWFNRDRFVLSNGHVCLLQYCLQHLCGYEHMTMSQLKSYHSNRTDSLCPGHPEIENPAVEVTTGPLGQGIANAVGLAMATRHLAATYNKPGYDVVDNTTWCMIGDACLQEGVGLEAASLAGHFRLGNLVVVYDNNQITCDGSADVANTEDMNAKMRACGWEVIEVPEGGVFDIEKLSKIFSDAGNAWKKNPKQKPIFINVRTVIGVGSKNENDKKAHGAAYGEDDVRRQKILAGLNPDQKFIVPEEVYDYFSSVPSKGAAAEAQWKLKLSKYSEAYPVEASELHSRIRGELAADWKSHLPNVSSLPTAPTSSRKASGLVCSPLAQHVPSFLVGTADLTPSCNVSFPGSEDFQQPDHIPTSGVKPGSYAGRYIHWGIREHAMCAVSNGLAAFNPGTFIPITSTFFMFYLYAAPAVRMGALQQLQCIHVATHDSIGTGEDGPTHQPIALASFYRALPDLLYIRPCDNTETLGAWEVAVEAKGTPSILSLSRQDLMQYPGWSDKDKVKQGAYVFLPAANFSDSDSENSLSSTPSVVNEEEKEGPADVTIIGVGSEMKYAVSAAEILEHRGIRTRVVSFPCQRLFEKQSKEYKRSVLRRHEGIPAVVVEAYSSNGWERYADAAVCMKSFGKSLPGKDAYKHFGFDGENIANRVEAFVSKFKTEDWGRGDFEEI